MDSKDNQDRRPDHRRSEHSKGSNRSYRSYDDNDRDSRQDSSNFKNYRSHDRGYQQKRGFGSQSDRVSRNYNQGSGRYDRKRSRSPDRDRNYHSGGGSNRDYSPDRKRGYGTGSNTSNSSRTDSKDLNKPFNKCDTKYKAASQGKEAADEEDIDEDDLRPISLNITCPAATTLVQQIEKRKLLFSKKETPVATTSTSSSSSVWQKTTFSDDSDGKVSAKFKRLMGMRDGGGTSGLSAEKKDGPVPDTQSKDFFSNLEKQYEVARTITHTQRGVGLGFGSSGGLAPRTSTWVNKPPPK